MLRFGSCKKLVFRVLSYIFTKISNELNAAIEVSGADSSRPLPQLSAAEVKKIGKEKVKSAQRPLPCVIEGAVTSLAVQLADIYNTISTTKQWPEFCGPETIHTHLKIPLLGG